MQKDEVLPADQLLCASRDELRAGGVLRSRTQLFRAGSGALRSASSACAGRLKKGTNSGGKG
jgi:hypothetical protein